MLLEPLPFGQWLKRLRADHDLTQEALAEAVGCAAQTIRAYESGTRRPSQGVAERLAKVLDVPPDQWAAFVRRARTPSDTMPPHAPTATEYSSVAIGPPASSDVGGAASIPVLTTKLFLPRPRAQRVSRPHLLARLTAGLQGALTLLAAPAGAGKTSLLADWLSEQPDLHVAWLSLDATDRDPAQFLRYLVAALQTIDPAVGEQALPLIQAAQGLSLDIVLPVLVNDLIRLPERSVLVLDDYHVIDAPAVHQLLLFLVEHLPPPLHLVIASRMDPPLPLARLRVRGHLIELRAQDLRFTREEVATFLQSTIGLSLPPKDVVALEARTEGWIAGLQMAALSLQSRPPEQTTAFIDAFTGSHRFVMDYLVEEVLARQPAHIQAFLLQTSILERLSGPLCDAVVLGEQDMVTAAPGGAVAAYSQLLLEDLEQRNLFIVPLDNARYWYRYHHLFAQVLRERLRHGATAEAVSTLHRRASSWFASQGLMAEAVHHALTAGDSEHAAGLIETIAARLALEGQQATVAGWLAQLPSELVDVRPRLVLARAYVHASNSDYVAVVSDLQAVEARLASADAHEAPALRREVAALRALAWSMLGDERALATGQQALAELPEHHPLHSTIVGALTYVAFTSGDLSLIDEMLQGIVTARVHDPAQQLVQLSTVALLAMVRRAQGRLRDVRRMSQEVLQGTRRDGCTLPVSGAFLAYLLLGLTQCEQNELDAAEQTLRTCAQLAGQYQVPMYELLAQFYLGQVRAARGDVADALRLVDHTYVMAERSLSPMSLREIKGYQVMLWLRQGDIARASNWALDYTSVVNANRPRFTAYDYDRFALVQTQMAQGNWDAAYLGTTWLLADAEATGHGRFVIWALVWQALIRHAQGKMTEALVPLARALALGAPEGYVRMFVDEGAPMAALLAAALERPSWGVIENGRQVQDVRGYAQDLLGVLQAGGDAVGDTPISASRQNPSLHDTETLTERELQVLRLLAQGHSNQGIAHELIVAVGTVKRHVNSILGKLGVQSRLEAVAIARTRNLV